MGSHHMKKYICQALVILSVAALVGCEWELSGDDDSWNDALNWINFSATYRGTGGNLVRNFSQTGSGSGGGDGGDGAAEGTMVVVKGETQGTMPQNETVLSGDLEHFPGVQDGSVTLEFFDGTNGPTIGTFTDSGGVLTGTFRYSGADSSDKQGTGTINYDTGAWTLNLVSPGFLVPAFCTADYTYVVTTNTAVDDTTPTADEDGTRISIYTFTVTQSGNQLHFVDSNGDTYEGVAWRGITPGGDDTGGTSGDVTINFEVKGESNGEDVTITGTFSGDWAAAETEDEGASGYGVMTGRIIDGTWTEDDGRSADVRGASTTDD